jgi:alanyl-tRNA synthetase
MTVNELRKKYLDYFKSKGHKVFASDSLVPDDPTVLFTSAGMNQFKPYFMGEKKDISRATSSQKCLRTGDLDNVGKTPCHHTFFEMLGNFSFGDYFKKEAIEFGWEFLTKELNIKAADLKVSVYEQDGEAYDIWLHHMGLPPEAIVRFGEKDNFWPSCAPSLGPDGPCGPCSEIYFDRKVGCGKSDCSPACDCRRYVEVWNLVFTQFNRKGLNNLESLPQKNIDTGMGLERMSAMMQGKESNFDIDNLAPIVHEVRRICKNNNNDKKTNSMVNAIVDHVRAASFCVCDGVYPSNEDRGYVVRKIIRKAAWNGNALGIKEAFLHQLIPVVIDLMKDPYPELKEHGAVITKVIESEEEKFLTTINDGTRQFAVMSGHIKAQKSSALPAADLFKLYDTYGFPLELSRDMAAQENLTIDEAGFVKLLKEQKERSRNASKFDGAVFAQDSKLVQTIKQLSCEFVGYSDCAVDSEVSLLVRGDKDVEKISTGEEGLVFLTKTAFYPEMGGQMADHGVIRTPGGEFLVEDTNKIGETIVHRGRVVKGEITVKDMAAGCIDVARRKALARAHTATHLLQAALRKMFGEHIAQQGSLVDDDRLRFDFTHFQAVNKGELKGLEQDINLRILDAITVNKQVLSLDEAKRQGALAFFKDKYKDEVRTVFISDFSRELCGGTHVDNTIEIGSFVIVTESSIASGTRRIEAFAGKRAYEYLQTFVDAAKAGALVLNCTVNVLPAAIDKLQDDIKVLNQKIDDLNKKAVVGKLNDLSKENINGVDVLVHDFSDASREALMHVWDNFKKQGNCFGLLLASKSKLFVCGASDDLVAKGITCKKFMQSAQNIGLKGGGKDNLVQGSAQNVDINAVKSIIKDFLK